MVRELWRVVANLVAFAFATRRFVVLLVVVGVGVAVALSTTVTVVGPVALYPLLQVGGRVPL